MKLPDGNVRANESPIKPAYDSIASQNNAESSRKLDFEPTLIENGNKFVIFDEELVENGSLKWKLTVCGHFVGMKMPYNEPTCASLKEADLDMLEF
ncbi:hypothetical protein Tco_0325177 [Tanacetum coccineum]